MKSDDDVEVKVSRLREVVGCESPSVCPHVTQRAFRIAMHVSLLAGPYAGGPSLMSFHDA